MKAIQKAINYPSGYEPLSDDPNTENNQSEKWLLFVVREQGLFEADKLGLRYMDLQKENASVNMLEIQQQQIQAQHQQLNG